MTLPIKLRDPQADDFSFVFNSWLMSNQENEDSKRMKKSTYFKIYKQILDSVLVKANILVACNPDDEAQVYGYLVYNRLDLLVVHYIYVKYTYRKLGIARAMLKHLEPEVPDKQFICTFANRVYDRKKQHYNVIYDPSLRGIEDW